MTTQPATQKVEQVIERNKANNYTNLGANISFNNHEQRLSQMQQKVNLNDRMSPYNFVQKKNSTYTNAKPLSRSNYSR